MITCHLCGRLFETVEDFEQHIDDDCMSRSDETTEWVGTQILYPDGTSEFKKLYPKPSDDFLHVDPSDINFTAPDFVGSIRLTYSEYLRTLLTN